MTDRKKFYITTPIYYVNDIPHIGHTYTTVVADVIARYKRLRGFNVYFLTGTDEHGQKIERAADKQGLKPIELADRVVERYKILWKSLGITYNDFIRTTEQRHHAGVWKLLQKIRDNGDIYLDKYSGWYCTGCEAFFPESQIVNGKCPDQGHDVEFTEEESYFFRLSRYQKQLLELYERHPNFIKPSSRRNEVISFVRRNLKDLSISRTSFSWGIPFPDDEKHVIYVWFDALANYISALGYGRDEKLYDKYWPADIHLVGKDILRFHTVYWPAFLMSAGEPLPETIFGHGWWLMEEAKMSKTKGNIVRAEPLIEEFGVDTLRYFLMREITFGLDGSYSDEALIDRHNGDLANNLGNLLSRLLTMIENFCGGRIPEKGDASIHEEMKAYAQKIWERFIEQFDSYDFSSALATVWDFIGEINRYIVRKEPWSIVKGNDGLKNVGPLLYAAAESLRISAVLIRPVMPGTSEKIFEQLGIKDESEKGDLTGFSWGILRPGNTITKGKHLFPRVDKEKYFKEPTEEQETRKIEKEGPMTENLISIDEFMKVDLRVGKIEAAERVEGTTKLLKIIIDIGTEKRQIVAGVADTYAPEQLIGKEVIFVANLKPARVRGVESQGMLLAADVGGKAVVPFFDRDIPTGSRVR
ncbi:MAG: methionine--tRNA ligase [Acidobacteriota bacterium]